MSTSDADQVAEQAAAEKKLRTQRAGADGKLADKARKNPRIGTVEPRNQIESVFLEHFGTVAPVPKETLRRKQNIITAATLYIHYNVPVERIAELVQSHTDYLYRVQKEDKWDEFAQQLAQLHRPSNLARVPQHDMPAVLDEIERRKAKLPALRKREEELMKALDEKIEVGSKHQSVAVNTLMKIRALIAETVGLDDFLREASAARTTFVKGQALRALGADGDNPNPAPVRGKIVDIQ